jgi:K+-transporting ATPase KdpF subunit
MRSGEICPGRRQDFAEEESLGVAVAASGEGRGEGNWGRVGLRKWIGGTERHARHALWFIDPDIFWIVRSVREILRWIEVRNMLDTIVSLAVCAGLLIYLVYAMLRPEKF